MCENEFVTDNYHYLLIIMNNYHNIIHNHYVIKNYHYHFEIIHTVPKEDNQDGILCTKRFLKLGNLVNDLA